MDRIDVIIPAGGKLDDHFARVALTPYKALITVQDNMVGFKTLDAVLSSGRASRIIVVGSEDVQNAFRPRVTFTINDTGDLTKNIATAIRHLKQEGGLSSHVLVITADLPYAETKSLLEFLDNAPSQKDICGSLITKAAFLDRFPASTSTWANLGGVEFTLAGAFLIKPEVFLRIQHHVEQVVQNRKSISKMVKLLGAKFAWAYLTKKLTLEQVVLKVEEVLGCTIGLVRDKAVDLAFDIDDIPDYEYALRNK